MSCPAGARPERRRGHGRPARPWLRRVLRHWGLHLRATAASAFPGVDTPFWLMLPSAHDRRGRSASCWAPTLRLRGDYLAIVTLGFGEIVPVVFLNSDTWTNGTNGIGGLDRPEACPASTVLARQARSYFVTMADRLGRDDLPVPAPGFAHRTGVGGNPRGRAGGSEHGINTVTTKLLPSPSAPSTAGLAGVFYGAKLVIVSPDQFHFDVSFTVLAMVVLGGMGNIWGVAVGAFVVYEIQHRASTAELVLRHSHIPVLKHINFIHFQFLLYGLALVGMMLLRPEGLFPSRQRRRELHATMDRVRRVRSRRSRLTRTPAMAQRCGERARSTGDAAGRQGHQAIWWPAGRQRGGLRHSRGARSSA